MARPFRSITLEELADLVETARAKYGDDALVAVSADYGDHSHTLQALPLRGEIESCEVDETGYSYSGFEFIENTDDDDEGEDEMDEDEIAENARQKVLRLY